MKILITKKIPEEGIQFLIQKGHDVHIRSHDAPLKKRELEQIAQDYDALLSMLSDSLDDSFFSSSSLKIKAIANYAVGINNIDLKEATKRNIPIGYTPDILSQATAELAFALLLSVARNISSSIKNVHRGTFQGFDPLGLLGIELQKKTVGIIGAGRIGKAFAKICRNGLEMDILYWGRTEYPDFNEEFSAKYIEDLNELLENSDIVSLHCPLTKETHSLLNYERLKKMKKNAILINTARGEIIVESDLVKILSEGHLFGVGVDVSSPEPMKLDNPLLKFPQFTITSHIGSATFETRREMALLCAKNLDLALKGQKMLTCANPEIYEKNL